MADVLHHCVGGRGAPGNAVPLGDVTKPVTGEVVARVPFGSVSLVADALRVAAEAPQNYAGVVKALDDRTASQRRPSLPGCPSPRLAGQATIHPTGETTVP